MSGSSRFLLYNARDHELVWTLQSDQGMHRLLTYLVYPYRNLELVPHGLLKYLFGHLLNLLINLFLWEIVIVFDVV